MIRIFSISLVALATLAISILSPTKSLAAEYFVYSVYKSLDLGNPGETNQKDFYINMGSSQGVKTGSSVKVYRKQATYDMASQKLYKDLVFPIATLKIIHVEPNAAVARLDQMSPREEAPATSLYAVMVGDLVKLNP